MARSAVDESSMTSLWPFPAAKLRLIAIPQLARDGDRGQEGSPKGTFEVEVGCFLVQQKIYSKLVSHKFCHASM